MLMLMLSMPHMELLSDIHMLMQLQVMLLQLQLSELLQLLQLLLLELPQLPQLEPLQLLLLPWEQLLPVSPPPNTTPRMRTRTSPLATVTSTVPDKNLETPILELSKAHTQMAETLSTMLLMPMDTVPQLPKQSRPQRSNKLLLKTTTSKWYIFVVFT